MNEVEVLFEPEGIRVRVPAGTLLSKAAVLAGIAIDMPCGGKGGCGKCRVQIIGHAPDASAEDLKSFGAKDIEQGMRLACQTPVHMPMTVVVPHNSRLTETSQILGSAGGIHDVSEAQDPPIWKRYVRLNAPTLEDDRADIERLLDAIGPCEVRLEMARLLPGKLRKQGFRGTAVLSERYLLDFEEDNTEPECYGVAFDLGTTTLVGVLLDLATGREIASASRMNPQTQYGDDVLSRIQRARDESGGLEELHGIMRDALNAMIAELSEKASIRTERIYEATFAGNTTMQHFLACIPPNALGEIPFAPAFRRSLLFPASKIGMEIHPRGCVVVFPVIGGFVGGDTVAGILVTGIAEAAKPTLFVDIGTNGELVVKHGDILLSASTAAGPAFEGANIKHGMRAMSGAIEQIVLDGDVHYKVIGGAKPVGLCGSALIDITAELLRKGILSYHGLLLSGDELPADLPPRLLDRVIMGEDGPEFVVALESESGTGAPVTVTHRDFRSLQLGTGAIRTGIAILLKQAGLTPAELDRVYVAGAFGNYIRPHNAQRMGLLPFNVELPRVSFVGNTSLAGARRVATSRTARQRAEELAFLAKHVELSRDPNFQMEYMEAMFFPMEEPV